MNLPAPPSLAPIQTALLAVLRTGTGRPFGDLAAPPAPGAIYGFLSRTSTIWEGSYLSAHEMVLVTYQVQCVALDTDGVDALEHRVMALLDSPPALPGWAVIDWEPLGSPGVRIDKDVDPERAYSTPQWRLIAQPTPGA